MLGYLCFFVFLFKRDERISSLSSVDKIIRSKSSTTSYYDRALFHSVGYKKLKLLFYSNEKLDKMAFQLKAEKSSFKVHVEQRQKEFHCDRTYKGRTIMFYARYRRNLFHTLNDSLMNIFALSKEFFNGQPVSIVSLNKDPISSWPFGYFFKNYTIIELPQNTDETVCFESLAIGCSPYLDAYTTLMKPQWMKEFRKTFLDNLKGPETHSNEIAALKENIAYIVSRKKNRRIMNENEIISLLKKYGYSASLLKPEKHKPYEIKTILSKAKLLIGVHGAGLTNMIFLSEKASIIQIYPYGMKIDENGIIYKRLAKSLNLNYYEWYNKHINNTFSSKINGFNDFDKKNQDTIVDVVEFERIVQKALLNTNK
ncbi:Glycosyltransferase AER61 domain-containing protein [Rozella allomycis CSF55]|uniref:Glycosyltransferase AER61 domain-containing protein n=1 Tax=Rozella allomycis (strain CSF55) TaxID=988480 RepID=A0A075AR48_ROZAC|nr:Glycosyltransferase AER61 domain-containing protein [Rozella allomycis CSF55]|eukprot:EPZ32766.1 Glycosyltransferase AER61 domain-containing protein [Rozella allomycis CSF55]